MRAPQGPKRPAPTLAPGSACRYGARARSCITFHGFAERLSHLPAITRVIGRGAKALVARIRRLNNDVGEYAARTRCHHHDALRQIDRLEDRMRDEDHRAAQLLPNLEQIVVEPEAGDLVECGERLIE